MYFLSHVKLLQSASISTGSFGREDEETQTGICRNTVRPEPRLKSVLWRWGSSDDSTKESANVRQTVSARSLWLVPAATAHPHPNTRLRGYQHFHHWPQGGKGDTGISAKEEGTNIKLLLPLILQKSTIVVSECVYTSSWQYICFFLKNLDFCAAVDCYRHESSFKIFSVWLKLRRSLICMEQRGDVLPHFHIKGKSFHSPSPAQCSLQPLHSHSSLQLLQQYQQQSCCWKWLRKGLEMETPPPSIAGSSAPFLCPFYGINVWFNSRKGFQAFSIKETGKLEAIGRLEKTV